LCTHIAIFSAASDGATTDRQILNRTFRQFHSILRKDTVTNYVSIWMMFTPSVRGLDTLYKL